MRHELLVAVEDGDVEVGVGVADEAPAAQVLQSKNRLTNNHGYCALGVCKTITLNVTAMSLWH